MDLISGLGRCPEVGNGNLFQYSCLENSMDREPWWTTVHGSQRVRHNWANQRERMRACTHTQSQFHSWPLGLWQLSEPHFLLNPNKAESICPGFFLGLMENPNEMRANSTWKWKVLDRHNIALSLVSGRHTPFMSSPNGQSYHARNESACSALHGLLTGKIIPDSKIMPPPKLYCLTFL